MRLTDWKIFVILNIIFWGYLLIQPFKENPAKKWSINYCKKINDDSKSPVILPILCKNIEIQPVRYDCQLAEISPDIPLDVKKQCRNLLRGN